MNLPDGDRPRAETTRKTLRPEDRIRRRSEYRIIQQTGRRVHTPHFVILILPRPELRCRLGITVTKKVSPNAVSRNRVKRLVREVFRRNRALFPQSSDVVVVAKKGAQDLGYDQVLAEFKGARPAMGSAAKRASRGHGSEERRGR